MTHEEALIDIVRRIDAYKECHPSFKKIWNIIGNRKYKKKDRMLKNIYGVAKKALEGGDNGDKTSS